MLEGCHSIDFDVSFLHKSNDNVSTRYILRQCDFEGGTWACVAPASIRVTFD